MGGEYITASASIKTWEETFHTEFCHFHHTNTHDKSVITKVIRAEHYSIPIHLHTHVESVFHTVQIPYPIFGTPKSQPKPQKNSDAAIINIDNAAFSNLRAIQTHTSNNVNYTSNVNQGNYVTATLLKEYYNIDPTIYGKW